MKPATPLTSQRRGGASHFYSMDLAGNTRALVSSAAAITDSYIYTAFGANVQVIGSTVNPYCFVGELGYYCDNLSRYYVRARHLQVNSGRWPWSSRKSSSGLLSASVMPSKPTV